MKHILVLGLLLVSAAGCATTKKFEENIASWEGATEEQLVSVWGPPQSVYPLQTGGKVLGFTRTGPTIGNTTYNQYTGLSTVAHTRYCTTNFTLDGGGTVRGWQYQGNACKAN